MTPYEVLKVKLNELKDIESAISILAWDQEVNLPAGSVRRRATQMASLNGLQHETELNDLPSILDAAEAQDGLSPIQKANLKEIRRALTRSTKLPTEYIKQLSMASSAAHASWVQAKKASDFSLFEPALTAIVDLKRKEAEYVGYEENPYDALMDYYEAGMKAATVKQIFSEFKAEMGNTLEKVLAAPSPDADFLLHKISHQDQIAFGKKVVQKLGYDFQHGRLDISAHPFSISFGPEDVRITTVVDEQDINAMLYSTIHEAGHGMYEQGLSPDAYGFPQGEACSLSIHESQSRLYENNLSRSLPFWEYWFEDLAALYPDKLKGKTPEDIFRASNLIKPGLVRIFSDELTYHFHIMLRFEIENALLNKEVEVKDLPAFWNEKIRSYLHLEVPSDAKGVLQDIHWAHGSFGYFPTYSLGSFYAAQFMAKAKASIPGLDDEFRKGNFKPLNSWLTSNIYDKGKLMFSNDLCKEATGEPLNIKYFAEYMKDKLGRVYNINL